MPRNKLLGAVLLMAFASHGQAQLSTRDPRWRTVGAGVLASRPATCTANRDVYICIGTGCSIGAAIHYCTAANTWSEQGGSASGFTGVLQVANGGSGAATLTGLVKGNGTSAFTAATAADIPATPLPTPGTSITLAAPRGYAICTDTCTVTLPVPAAGYEFCIRNGNNVSTAITLAALGSSAMYENTAGTAYGTAGTGTLVSTAAAGNKVCLVGLDATHYLVMSYIGSWTAN